MLKTQLRMYANNPANVCYAENASLFSRAKRERREVGRGPKTAAMILTQYVCDVDVR